MTFSRATCDRLIGQCDSALKYGQLQPYADALRDALAEIDALRHANASLIPGGVMTATEIECLRVERDGARRERDRWKLLAEHHAATMNRETEPCADDDCKHVYDEWPADTVTRRDRDFDQCSMCGWTATQLETYRARGGT